ncbi:AraC family transcriptional regulator [Paenibacillus oryzisoli]|uniref:AraC family transcriptional regulator n=1 Tax=Paenibacillus oryzisoli TaxID=1850517 RepID=UPI003D2D17CC
MNPMRKDFDAQPTFPFSFVCKETKTIQRELPDHLHDWFELVFVHGGKGSFFIDQTIYDIGAGDLFIIPGNTIHRALPDNHEPVTSSAIFFNPFFIDATSFCEPFSYLQCFEYARKNKSFRHTCTPALIQIIETEFNRIELELQSQCIGHWHAVVLHIQRILLEVNREIEFGKNEKENVDFGRGPAWMRTILQFVDLHFTEDLSLHTLCVRAAVSPAHFSRVFKHLTGMNVTEYILLKRIIHAKNLLLETEDKVSTIAGLCGFDSMSHFYRVFKQYVGVTPVSLRKQSND